LLLLYCFVSPITLSVRSSLLRTTNKKTGEINTIQPGGLYAAFPIPAYQVLARMGEHQAKNLLMCLVSHMGMNNTCVFPSYSTIAAEAGLSRNSIRKNLDILEECGFIKTFQFKQGKKVRNKYYIQPAAYNSGLMNNFARRYRNVIARCHRCGKFLNRGEFGQGPTFTAHFGCGGSVKVYRKVSRKSD